MSRVATEDPALAAVIVDRVAMYYRDGADAALDRPAHVRAGSSLARVPGGIAVVQDDANFLAVVDPRDGRARAIALPAGHAGMRQFDDLRGNKRHKLDLEACFSVEGEGVAVFVALGSGSTPERDRVLVVGDPEAEQPRVTLVRARRLYDTLRREQAFAGSELNVEGAVHLDARVRLFGRGNGAPRAGMRPVNATCDLDWAALRSYLRDPDRCAPPRPTDVVRYELGTLGGVPLSFTDATARGRTILYSAAAEESPDATRDGRVTGSAIGAIDDRGRVRWTPLAEPSGAPFVGKVEGLVTAGDAESAGDRIYVVVDTDDPRAASLLCTVELRGAWAG